MSTILWLSIAFILIALVVFKLYKRKKKLVINQVNVITGAPKTCKSFMSVALAVKDYKHRVFVTRLKNFFRKIFKKPLLEKPCLYSTIPLAKVPYVELTRELLLRDVRFAYNSTILVDEAFLIADSMTYKDDDLNENISLLMKLCGHELHGGAMFLNTQNIHDVHYAIKRCATSYIYILSKQKLPFFMHIKCRELINSDEVSIVNTISDDAQDDLSMHSLFFSKKWFKYYDCYAYSKMTDNLPVANHEIYAEDLKTDKIVSFKEYGKNAKKEKK